MNDTNTLREEYLRLKNEVARHDHLYYSEDNPEITDAEYDALYRQLEEFEANHPDLADEDSPTRRVGGAVLKPLGEVKHIKPMLSLKSAMSRDEAFSVINRIIEKHGDIDFIMEPKYDGLSAEIRYVDGVLALGVTRGDGFVGENVTHNIRMIRNVPARLPEKHDIRIRGEVIVDHDSFERINRECELAGKKKYSNCRNLAAGSLRLLDAEESGRRGLRFMAYGMDVDDARKLGLKKQSEIIRYLHNRLGFEVSDRIELASAGSIDDIYREYQKSRDGRDFGYDIDGMVIKVDSLDIQDEIGWNSTEPKWAVAYKFTPEMAMSRILDVEFQVGRTGKLTPVAKIAPVFVGGALVSSITLNNQDWIDQKDIRILDTVYVRRAGDVIPEIAGVCLEKRTGEEKKITIPDACPACGGNVSGNGAGAGCVNPACSGRQLEQLLYFVSRETANIENIGRNTMILLSEHFGIKTPADLFDLPGREDEIAGLPGLGAVSASKITNAIESARNMPLERFLYSLGINNVGKGTAARLAAHFGSIEDIMLADSETIARIKDIGPVTADSIVEYFRTMSFETGRLLEKIRIIPPQRPERTEGNELGEGSLSGLKICVTGTLPVPRQEVVALITRHGGTSVDSVSKNTSLLVVGEKPGSKLSKAEKLGIKIVDFDQLSVMCQQLPPGLCCPENLKESENRAGRLSRYFRRH